MADSEPDPIASMKHQPERHTDPPASSIPASGESVLHTNTPSSQHRDPELLHDLDGHLIVRRSHIPFRSGGFCDVFIGDHPTYGKVAMRRPRVTMEGYTSKELTNFYNECIFWKKLSHPNILPFLGLIQSNQHIWAVSLFAEHGSVTEYLKSHPEADRRVMVCQLADAVRYLHRQEVVHGDIKGSNVLISSAANVLLCDFGLSKLSGVLTRSSLAGAVSLRWCAPELLSGASKTFASDVYAFGMTVYEIVSGNVPFHNLRDEIRVFQALNAGHPPALPPASPGSGGPSGQLWDIACESRSRDPTDRKSMEVVCKHLGVSDSLSSGTTAKEASTMNVSASTLAPAARNEESLGVYAAATAPIQSGVIQPNATAVSIAEGVAAIGVKRPGFGTAGRPAIVDTNCFNVTIPTGTIYQYDVDISPQTARMRKMELIRDMFGLPEFRAISPVRGVYDGSQQYFSIAHIGEARQFQIPKGRKTYTIRLKLVAELDPSVLARYTRGEISRDHTEKVDTVLAASNVAIRMRLIEQYDLYNRNSFFVPGAQTRDMYFRGRQWAGIQMIRGFFQSIRPAMGRTVINTDIATGVVVTEGPLVVKFVDFMGKGTLPFAAACNEVRRADRRSLQQAANTLRGMKFYTEDRSDSRLVIKAFTVAGAQQTMFNRNGAQTSVARYFQEKGTPLQYPDLICIVGLKDGNYYPMEVCTVPTQLLARQVDEDQIADVLRFSAPNPHVRLQLIREAFQFLQYEGSPYLQDFGININPNPLRVQARILPPPQLQFGGQARVTPRDGTWRAQKLFNTVAIQGAMLLVYDRREPQDFFTWLNRGCQTVGIPIDTKVAPYTRLLDPAQPDVVSDIQRSLKEFKQLRKTEPNLILVVLPDEPKTLYNAVKYAGDVILGIATQCMKVGRVWKDKGRDEYFVNLCLKINVKLGGTNIIPQPAISSEQTPTLFLGADVMHSKFPVEEGLGRPSFCGVTGSIDIDGCKYAGILKAQRNRVEMIQPLEEMVTTILTLYKESKNPGGPPKRVIYFRDGVAENQFKDVIRTELPQIRTACNKSGMKGFKLTCVIVGKKHHFRAIPADNNQYRRDQNALAGTVIDTIVTSPIESDYYLLGQPGLQGTSRPAHYNVLVDENNFMADELQQLSFNLCHIYARSTRSVSLPAPVYYAHLLCARAATRYDPTGDFNLDSPLPRRLSEAQKEAWLQRYMDAFKDVRPNMLRVMYFL